MALPDFPDYHKWGFSLAALNSSIYVTGGHVSTPRPPAGQAAERKERKALHLAGSLPV